MHWMTAAKVKATAAANFGGGGGGGERWRWHNIADRPISLAFCNASHVVLCQQLLYNDGRELPEAFTDDFSLLVLLA